MAVLFRVIRSDTILVAADRSLEAPIDNSRLPARMPIIKITRRISTRVKALFGFDNFATSPQLLAFSSGNSTSDKGFCHPLPFTFVIIVDLGEASAKRFRVKGFICCPGLPKK
jgi:hypothetical protein